MKRVAYGLKAAVLAVSVSLVATAPALADPNFPVKPMRMIVPLAPGGGGDIVARMIAGEMQAKLGQPMVVENRPGASTIIGTAEVAKAAPDGYTLVMATSSHVINPHLRKLPFDPVKDFTGVTLIATTPAVLVAHPSLPAETIPDLIKMAKSKPGELTFASSGAASSPHLSGELLNLMAKTDVRHIPYKGMGPALGDLLGKHVSILFSSPVSALPHIQNGKLKAIATTGLKRSANFPDLPTIAETLPGYQSQIFYVVLAPKGTPPDVINKLNQAMVKIARSADFEQKMVKSGAEIVASSPAEAMEFIQSEIQSYGKLIREAKISVD